MTIGWMTPCMRIDAASTSSSSGSMDERGCLGFGAMLEILIEEIEAAEACASKLGMRASRPRPSPARRGVCLVGVGFSPVRSFTVAGYSSYDSSVNQALWRSTVWSLLERTVYSAAGIHQGLHPVVELRLHANPVDRQLRESL